ncbi:single-stranded-DNA-specific exonuclease RecJ [Alkalibaculum sp. M08DMB]|uniref:Single-stranded-DNA-specific exonuclease RecJ n=2 Tax=Alkalibaculum sporogenes TaxID=2655001 RepID=A0A6A7K5Y8_9FIRM|nr:single-stranded-DNA-specific exonuclease RecJ [Alkalibaculum sporogenes]MPW24563.1 single-stranded-DNA-specific exonuclease RecJ [Alkalibaculum sporogenes]
MSSQLKISEEVCRVMVNRGITSKDTISQYLTPVIENLHNPKTMLDLEKAVNILTEAINTGKSIRIVSDYDVDGVISCYVLIRAIKRCGGIIDYVIPHRVEDGYGINERIVQQAAADSIDILITCDNGISAFNAIDLAKSLGITVIITDHHQIPYKLDENNNKIYQVPCADAIVNPKQIKCQYPFKELCGAGVVFKLIQYLYEVMKIPNDESINLLQYVAIATICDIVDLVGENRIIAKNGLEMLNNTENLGLKELIKVSKQDKNKITSYTLGFILGPCINAVGRLDSGDKAVELLLSQDETKVEALGNELYELNMKRRALTEEGFNRIIESIENSTVKNHKVKIFYDEEIHESVAGIIAGRVKDKYHVPVIILTDSGGVAKGSGRSIDSYNIYEELSSCSDILEKYGGHSMAAGLSIKELNIPHLRDRLNERFNISEEDLIPKLPIDVFMPFERITHNLIQELEVLEPFGKGNGKPVFGDKDVRIIKGKIFGKNSNVLSLKLVSSSKGIFDGIYFGDIDKFNKYIKENFGSKELENVYNGSRNTIKLDIAYFPKLNTYRGNSTTQIHILHFK